MDKQISKFYQEDSLIIDWGSAFSVGASDWDDQHVSNSRLWLFPDE